MSWIELLGEPWKTTGDTARLQVHLWPPLAHCPRRSWTLSLKHYEHNGQKPPARRMERWIDLEIGELNFHEPDWRTLAGLEIRADAEWHARHEHFHEYGRLVDSTLDLHATYPPETPANPKPTGSHQHWIGHDFLLRLGQRDGFTFSCEIEAWLLDEEAYHRTEPETPAELACFGDGPPDLRILAPAVFTGGTVCVPRSDDPIPLAREYLREQIGLEEAHGLEIEWAVRRKPGDKESERMPGWTSTVRFTTRPKNFVE
jgi:hypothetical protein